MKATVYDIVWQWRDSEGMTPQTDVVMATNAQRAINKFKNLLSMEYSDVNKNFVPLDVARRLS